MEAADEIGPALRTWRQECGLSQRELARRAGLSLGAVRDLEQGRSGHPRMRSVEALADVLQLSAVDRQRLRRLAVRPRPEPVTPAGPLHIAVLGPLVVSRRSVPVELGFGRQRAVLARLAMTPNHPVSRDELIDVLWGGAAPPSAANVLQTHVSRLRRLLEPAAGDPVLTWTPGGYRLRVDESQLDLLTYRSRLADCRRVTAADPQRGFQLLAEALDLWRGQQTAEDVAELRGHHLVTALTDELIEATVQLAGLGRTVQRLPEVLPRLRLLAAGHPWHEPLHAWLVLALAAAGQKAVALQTYDDVARRLSGELGVDPGAELAAARRTVLEGTAEADGAAVPWQAPAAPPDFVGRAGQLRELRRLVRPAVACVISGMPGVGKTSLALRAAESLRDAFPDGQLYLDLRGADRRPVGLPEVVARLLRGLGVPARGIPADVDDACALYRSRLSGRRMLVILDNARNGEQVRPLLAGPGGSAVLITSRQHCADLPGAEHVDLPELTVDESVAMLAGRHGADWTDRDRRAAVDLAEACGRLPVALRIMVSRRPRWPIADLLQRLADTRSRLRRFGAGDVTVTATFDLGYRELAPAAARVFRLLAHVPGPTFPAGAVAALLGDDEDAAERILDGLVEESMIQAVAAGRFRFHDLLRLYAEELAAPDRDGSLRRLADWYLTRTAAAIRLVYPAMVRLPTDADADRMSFADLTAAGAWLDDEVGNLVALIEALAAGAHRARAWQLADQLRGYFFVRRDTVAWFATGRAGMAAAEAAGDRTAQAAMHQTIGQAHWSVGEHRAALEQYRHGVDAARAGGWRIGEAYLLHNLGLVHAQLGMVDEARDLYRHVLAAGAGKEFAHIRAVTLNDLGTMCAEQGRLPEAAGHFRAALAINQDVARLPSATANRSNLGMVLRQLEEFDAAYECFAAALGYYRDTGSTVGQLSVLDELSQLHQQRAEWSAAVGAATEAMAMAEQLGDQRSTAGVLVTLGFALLGARAVTEARARFAAALELSRANGYPYFQAHAGIGVAAAMLAAGEAEPAAATAGEALAIAERRDYRLLAGHARTTLAEAVSRMPDRQPEFAG